MKPGVLSVVACVILSSAGAAPAEKLDREAVVRRHHPVLEKADNLTPLGVGLPGGDFVFTADVTGLQTLVDFHADGQRLHSMAGWSWHAFPNPRKFTLADVTAPHVHEWGTRPYSPKTPPAGLTAEKTARWPAAADWLRANPHRLPLGRLGFTRPGGAEIRAGELSGVRQELDLWRGVLVSRFQLDGAEVRVLTVPARDPDGVAVRIESDLLESGKLGVSLSFPGASAGWGEKADDGDPAAHRSERTASGANRAEFRHTLDETVQSASLRWSGKAALEEAGVHRWLLRPAGARVCELRLGFAPGAGIRGEDASFSASEALAAEAWRNHWQQGGMVDFSGSKDPRAAELERRVVLSRHLTAIHCAGPNPPQETGNAQNSWHGKFHLEMLPWHSAQFALWGYPELLDRQLDYYRRILPKARATAAAQGCMGARWPKMTDPDGNESPSDIGVFLAWQQPHPIYLAELVRRALPGRATLEKHREMVYATADFIATFPRRGADGKLHLEPPLIPAQECYKPEVTRDPAFELAYFRWALGTAREWRKALGEAPEPMWDRVWNDLAPPPVVEDRYATMSGPPFTLYHDHPCVLMMCGWLPPDPALDLKRFAKTYEDIAAKWQWSTTWGWDPPVLALAAARLDRPADAVDELLRDTPKNRHLANGHNYQEGRLPLYLPGNGGLLHAVAAMVAGWEGAPERPHPGFPADGTWKIRAEGILPPP